MKIKEKKQLSFDSEIYKNPDSPNAGSPVRGDKPAQARKSGKSKLAVPASLQPFLPGLSRRGRPRSKNPVPSSVRASESRKRRMEAGMKRVELVLEPGVIAGLDALVTHFRISRVEVISRLVARAAKRIIDRGPGE